METDEQPEPLAGAHRRRDYRRRRIDPLREWRDGRDVDSGPVRERWTREGRQNRSPSAGGGRETLDGMVETTGEGMVVERHRRSCVVRSDEVGDTECRYPSVLPGADRTGVVVGDAVRFGVEPNSGDCYLTELLPRRSKLSRPGPPDREHREQLLAANIDQLVVVSTVAQPLFRPGLIDRYLLVAEWSELPLLLVVNKIDLSDTLPSSLQEFEGLVEGILPVSVTNGKGLEELEKRLRGKSSVLTGHSGVGKSSLVRVLVPGALPETGEVRDDGKGRHTTVASSVHELPGGGTVIDTPGIRGLGIWKAEPELLPLLFPPFRPYVNRCRFANCRHDGEPGCAVEEGFLSGKIPERFRESYRRILEDLERDRP